MNDCTNLPTLEKDDYLIKNADFWKNYRKNLYKEINKQNEKLEKTADNIAKLAKEIGVKPTARYFNMSPASVRYNIKKSEELN